ncbi:MAG: cold-shock protein [Andreesenia angusta]|nr:cold-shock protein [Andreesenia angusta]MDO5707196.1 cold-shock protein [Andreesenia angusta]
MNNGTVKWFNSEKGYGFITDQDGTDSFAHYSSINGEGYKTLEEGQEVSYTIETSERGNQAKDITIL